MSQKISLIFSVVVFFGVGLLTRAQAQAPTISTQPTAQGVAAGGSVTLTTAATGAATLTYQWYLNGVVLSGRSTASITLTNVQAADVGNYSVAVSNGLGTAISNAAAVTLNSAPTFTGVASGAGLLVEQGSTASISVTATGSPAPTFQWSKNGAALTGQTASTLSLTNVQPSSAGVYTVTATNTLGSVTSGSIELTVARISSGTGPLSISTSGGTQISGNVNGTTGELTGGVTFGGSATVVAPKLSSITSKSGLMLQQGETTTLTATATGSPSPSYQWFRNSSALTGQTGASLTLTNVQPADAGNYQVTATNSAGSSTSDNVVVTVASIGAGGQLAIAGGDGTQINGSFDPVTGVLTAGVTNGTAAAAPKLGDIITRSDLLLEIGKAAALKTNVSGSPTPAVQWFKNGTAIAGATSANYAIASVGTGDAGAYTVQATNANGTVTSSAINVSVTSLTSGGGSLTVATAGGTRIDGTVDAATGALSGVLTTSSATGAGSAPRVVSLSSRGSAFVNQGSTLSLQASASGNPAPAFQWFREGAALTGQTASTLTLTNVQPSDAGAYTVRATNSAGAVISDSVAVTVASLGAGGQIAITGGDGTNISGSYDTGSGKLTGGVTTGVINTVVAPTISDITGASDLLLQLGQTTTLNVSASGNPAPTYQWFRNSVPLPGATAASYTIGSVQTADAGTYTVVATNSAGSATSTVANVSVTSLTGGGGTILIATAGGTRVDGNVDPVTGALSGGITTAPPAGVTATAPKISSLGSQGGLFLNQGSSATLTAAATGNPAPVYQWLFNGAALAGQTGPALTLSNVQPAQAGVYTVRATNSGGSALSDAIPVTVASIGSNGQIAIAAGNGVQVTAGVNPSTGALTGTAANPPAGTAVGAIAAKITSLTSDPASLLIERGAPATLSVPPSGSPPPSYQWFKNGVAIAGQTNPTLAFAAVQDADAGDYTVSLTNSAGTVTSNRLALTVSAIGQDGAIAVSTSTGTRVSAVLDPVTGALLGSVSTGSTATAPKVLAVEATPGSLLLNAGTSATLSVLANASPAPTYQWFKDGAPLSGRTNSDLSLINVTAADAGTYVVRVTNAAGSAVGVATVVSIVRIGADGSVAIATGTGTQLGGAFNPTTGTGQGAVTTPAPSSGGLPDVIFSKLTNFSSLGTAGAGDNLVVAGFVVAGSGSRQLLVRAVGPGLAAFGVGGTLNAPVLTLSQGTKTLATNSGWTSSPGAVELSQAAARAGAFPLNADGRDAALIATLDPGGYTAQVSTTGTGTGQALIELYDTSASATDGSRVVNFSTRQKVGASGTLSAGFYVTGNTSKRVLIRAVGPTLSQSFSLAGVLPAPVLRVLGGAGTVLATNRDYRTSPDAAAITAASAASGAFPFASGAADSAVILILQPGSYSALINDATGATGTAMVEIYELP